MRDKLLKQAGSREIVSNSHCHDPYQGVRQPNEVNSGNTRKAYTSEGTRAHRSNGVYKLRQAIESQYSVNNTTSGNTIPGSIA